MLNKLTLYILQFATGFIFNNSERIVLLIIFSLVFTTQIIPQGIIETGLCYNGAFTSLSLYKGQTNFHPYFFSACNREDRNGDGITQDWSNILTYDDSVFNWISFNRNFNSMTKLVLPQGKTNGLISVPNDFFIDTKYMQAGTTYLFRGMVASETTGGGAGTRIEIYGPVISLNILAYTIEVTDVSSLNGSYLSISLSWNTPNIEYWNLDHYKIYKNDSDTIRISELNNSTVVKDNINLNTTSSLIKSGQRSVNSFYAVVGYDSLGEAIALSESFQAIYPQDNFGLLYPTDGQILTTQTPAFDWEDFAGATSYTLWYSEDSTFATKTEVSGITTSDYTIVSPLDDNRTYFWKVMTNGGISSNETGWNFGINISNQAPGNVSLDEPINGTPLGTISPLFTWIESYDPGDKINYQILISNDPSFNDTVVNRESNVNFYKTVDLLQDDHVYYWKIICKDAQGLTSISEVRNFITNVDDQPTGFKLHFPTFNYEERAVETNLYPTFTWYPSTDPDGGSIVYDLYYSTDSTFSTYNIVTGINDTFYTVLQPLLEDRYYFWKVKAIDNQNVEKWSYGLPNCFVTNEADKDPTPAPLLYPIDNRVVDKSEVLMKWSRPEDDIYDIHRYDLLYSKDSTFIVRSEILDIQDRDSITISNLDAGRYFWKIITNTHNLPPTAYGSPPEAGSSESIVQTFYAGDSYISDVSYPFSGVQLQVSNICEIVWNGMNVDSVIIELSSDSGLSWETITERYPYAPRAYYWRVPNNIGDNFRIKVTDIVNANNYAISSGDFSIIEPNKTLIIDIPNGLEEWRNGTIHTINWTVTNVDSVILEYSTDGGSTWNIIIDKIYSGEDVYPQGQGFYDWLIPNTLSSNCLIKITDYFYPQKYDISDQPFSIVQYPVIYISISGDDNNGDGSNNNPYRTIQKGIDIANSGDSLRVTYGEFNESINFLTNKSIYIAGAYNPNSWERDLHLDSTIINPGGTFGIQLPITLLSLDGFTITNASTALYRSSGAYVLLELRNCQVHDVNRIFAATQAYSVIVKNSIFYNCATGFDLIRLTNSLDISNSVFKENSGICINNLNSSGELRTIKITNNTFYSNSTAIGIFSDIYKPDIISNNIFMNNDIAVNNDLSPDLSLENNLFYNNTTDTINIPNNTNNIFGFNPLFVNPEDGNFRLFDSSPCIGSGQPNELSLDIEGNLRPNPDGSDPDIGAYENPLADPFSGLILNLKINLEGPYYSGAMSNSLNTLGHIPLQQPFNQNPYFYDGTEGVTTIPTAVSDWILIELRTGLTPDTKIFERAAFIKNDGSVVDLNGVNQLKINGIDPGSYYVVVYHRDHLSVMSAVPLNFLLGEITNYDFTDSQTKAYTTGANPMKDLGSGKYGMIAGDADGDGNVDYQDDLLLKWIPNFGLDGYFPADFNMNGTVDYEDDVLQLWLNNFGYSSQVPGVVNTKKLQLRVNARQKE